MSPSEEWRDSLSLPEYRVSNLGRVWCKPHTRRASTRCKSSVSRTPPNEGRLDDQGRPILTYRRKNYRISRLVCEAFRGPAPFIGAVVMHKDDNPANNRIDNLEWGTQKQNLNTPSFLAYCRTRTGENNPYRKGVSK